MLRIQCIGQASAFPYLVPNAGYRLLDTVIFGQFHQHLQRTVQRQTGTEQSGQLLRKLADFAGVHAASFEPQDIKAEATLAGLVGRQRNIAGFLQLGNDHLLGSGLHGPADGFAGRRNRLVFK